MKKENKHASQTSADLAALLEYSRFTKRTLTKPSSEVFDLFTDKYYMETVYDDIIKKTKKSIDKSQHKYIDFEKVRMDIMCMHTQVIMISYM
ncbi:hypothetical protein [Klebsiella sp. K4-170]|jgi:hypothetical protein|uniref:hypothetical protein n=1 Tax=Enterobacterales TaxID=91347 RepID=UPI0024DE3918|nr:hypothetical protein [Klebsiella sp. K4-170]MDK1901902.1 hypothetical protein [Klebsiella sp. K4-170]